MPILDSEILFYRSTGVTDLAATNGGRLSASRVVSGVKNNLLPDIGRAERTSGGRTLRKEFCKFANDDDLQALSVRLWQDRPTVGDDYVCWYLGTQRNFQAALTGSERKYGAANLSANATAGSSTLVVTVEHADLTTIFQAGDTILVSDKSTATAVSGNEEFRTISGAPVVVGLEVTITTTTPLGHDYATASGARVSTVYEAGTVAASADNWAETSTLGTYDESGSPVALDHIGTVEQTWTLTFSDATHFAVVGDTLGAVGSGTTSADFAPSNPDFTRPYFTLPAAGWAGTWATGETIVFLTHPAAVAYWVERTTPAGAAVVASSTQTMVCDCESV